jgi:hypothetical protein
MIFPITHIYEKDLIAYEAGTAMRRHSNQNDLILVDTLHTNVAPGDMYPTILYYAKRKGWNIDLRKSVNTSLNQINILNKRGAQYLIITHGRPARRPISSFFPFFRYFDHTTNINCTAIMAVLKAHFNVIIETSNFAIFSLHN